MRRILTALLFKLLPAAVLAQGASSPLTALDQDHRARAWEAVGRLDTGMGFCSATLIASDLVLSAAHCVYDPHGQRLAPGRLVFRAGLREGVSVAERRVARIAAHPGFDPEAPFSARNIAHDVALLQLEAPISTRLVDPFVLHRDAVRPGEVSVVSYGQGREHLPSRQRSCGLLARQSGVLLFDCNVTFGSSGAPVFSHLNGRGRILSVISGRMRLQDGREVSVGPHLPPLVEALKRDLRAQDRLPVARIQRTDTDSGRSIGGARFIRAD